jgi:hypothetical protein
MGDKKRQATTPEHKRRGNNFQDAKNFYFFRMSNRTKNLPEWKVIIPLRCGFD